MIDSAVLQSVAELLCEVRQRPPDSETKVGAALLTPVGCKVKATGYNAFLTDNDYPTTRPNKYAYIIHAEASIVADLGAEGCRNRRVVITHAPCNECVKLMIRAGVSEIWYFDSHLGLADSAVWLLRNAGVKVFNIQCEVENYHLNALIEIL